MRKGLSLTKLTKMKDNINQLSYEIEGLLVEMDGLAANPFISLAESAALGKLNEPILRLQKALEQLKPNTG